MPLPSFRHLGVLVLTAFFSPAMLLAQGLPSGGGLDPAPKAAPAPPKAPAGTVNATDANASAGGPALDPAAAVKSVIAMFTPNDLVNVPALGKPLPQTGTWGAQTHFPDGLPKPCVDARVPCLRVVYRVPEANVLCLWLVGYLVAVEPQPDGSVKHAVHEIVLDENADAAHYTMRKEWSRGDPSPKPLSGKHPVYPEIAQQSGVDGIVAVRLVIGPDGSVTNIAGIAGPKLLREPVLDAVRTWKFAPPQIGSQVTSYRLDQYFTFNKGHLDFSDMDPSGRVMEHNDDPRYGQIGYNGVSTSGVQWESCSGPTCSLTDAPR